MRDIHQQCVEFGTEKNRVDYVKGANIAGFVKVAEAMVRAELIDVEAGNLKSHNEYKGGRGSDSEQWIKLHDGDGRIIGAHRVITIIAIEIIGIAGQRFFLFSLRALGQIALHIIECLLQFFRVAHKKVFDLLINLFFVIGIKSSGRLMGRAE